MLILFIIEACFSEQIPTVIYSNMEETNNIPKIVYGHNTVPNTLQVSL